MLVLKGVTRLRCGVRYGILLSALVLPGAECVLGAEVVVRLIGDSLPSKEGLVVAELNSDGASKQISARLVGSRAELELTEGQWRVSLEADGYWSTAEELIVGLTPAESPAAARLLVYRTGTIRALVAARTADLVPDSLRVLFRGATRPSSTFGAPTETGPSGSLPCPVSRNPQSTTLSCEIPIGKLDIRFRAPGLVTRFRWGVEVQPGAAADLGVLRLVPGASLTGWLETEDRSAIDPNWEILAIPLEGGYTTADPFARESIRSSALAATLRPDGFFHFDGIPAGGYRLEVEVAGFGPASRAPIQVLSGVEANLRDPLVLQRPRSVRFYVQPEIGPSGEPWSLRIERYVSIINFSTVGTFPVELDGWCEVPSLASGNYRVTLQQIDGRGWLTTPIEIEGATDVVSIEAPVLAIEGSLRLGEDPIAGHLFFGGARARDSVELVADEEGRFEGHLPRSGLWDVTVEGRDLNINRTLNGVEVRKPRWRSTARVEIELPNTLLRGTVRLEDGAAPSRGMVSIQQLLRPERTIQVFTERDGSWSAHGVPEGPLRIFGSSLEGESDTARISVSEDLEAPPIELVIRTLRVVSGKVVHAGTPVPGASVIMMPVDLLRGVPVETTGADGSFEARVVRGVRELLVTVMATGFSLHVGRHPIVGDNPRIDIELTQAGGILELSGLDTSQTRSSQMSVLLYGGGYLAPNDLMLWAAANAQSTPDPSTIVVTAMSPGAYALCTGVSLNDLRRMVLMGVASVDRCASGVLTSGGTLALSVLGDG